MTPNGLQKVSWIIPNYNYSDVHPTALDAPPSSPKFSSRC